MLDRKRVVAAVTLAFAMTVGRAAVLDAQSGSAAQKGQKGQQQAQKAQQQGQQQAQQQQQQQRLRQLDLALQRTERIRDRLHQMDQELTRDMDRIRDQDRLREHQAVRDMGRTLGQVADNLRGATLQLRDRERDQLQLRDQEMQRDMERLREHVQNMGVQLEDGLKIMERLQQRLRVLQPPK